MNLDETEKNENYKKLLQKTVSLLTNKNNIKDSDYLKDDLNLNDNLPIIFHKDEDGNLHRTYLSYDDNAENPRSLNDNLGTMVFLEPREHRSFGFGDRQITDYSDFFIEELEKEGLIKNYRHKKYTFEVPKPEDVIKDPFWKDFVNGNSVTGLYIDKPFFDQYLGNLIESLDLNKDWGLNIEEGVPLVDNKLSDEFYIEFQTPLKNEFNESIEYIEQSITENLDSMGVRWFQEELPVTEKYNESSLFEIWKNTKAAVLAMDIHEHSGIALHESSVRKTNHVNNDRDDGYIKNSGLIYLNKDNEEYKIMISQEASEEKAKAWAERIFRGEINDYDNYLENNVYTVTDEIYDFKNRIWNHNSIVGNYYPDNEHSYFEQYAGILLDSGNINVDSLLSVEEALSFVQNSEEKIIPLFFKEASEKLSDFENNPLLAYKAQLLLWNNNGNTDRADVVNSFVLSKCKSPKELNFFLIKEMNISVTPENIHSLAEKVLPLEDINNNSSDLYIATSPVADELISLLDKSTNGIESGMITTFTDQVTGKKTYELPFCAAHNCNIFQSSFLMKPIKTTYPTMSSTENKIHKMFDDYFNKSNTDPYSFALYCVTAGNPALNGERYWQNAVDHGVNSGGEMFDSTYDRIKILEQYGLIKNNYEEPELQGKCYEQYLKYMKEFGTKEQTKTLEEFVIDCFSNKTDMTEYLQKNENLLIKYNSFSERKENALVDKYCEKADSLWAKYMFSYMKDLKLFKEPSILAKKESSIQKYNELHQKQSLSDKDSYSR